MNESASPQLAFILASDRERLRNDYQTVTLTQREFESLPEYSCSLPTGTTPGKQWKRAVFSPGYGMKGARLIGWLLGEFGQPYEERNRELVPITWRRIARIRCRRS